MTKKTVYVIQRKHKTVTKYYSTWTNAHGRWCTDPVFAMHFQTQAHANQSVATSCYIDVNTSQIIQMDLEYALSKPDHKHVSKVDSKWVIGHIYSYFNYRHSIRTVVECVEGLDWRQWERSYI